MEEKYENKGQKSCALIERGFTDPELWYPYYRFLEEGADAYITSIRKGVLRGEAGPHNHTMQGWEADVTHTVDEVLQMDFDILFLVGGVYAPMFLRNDKSVQELVRKSVKANKLTCAVCHAPQILISADVIRGRKISCPRDMAVDVVNAGGFYTEEPAVIDGCLLTSESYNTLPEMFRLLMGSINKY